MVQTATGLGASQPNFDLAANRKVSVHNSNILTERIAAYQTDEDGGGEEKGDSDNTGRSPTSFLDDIIRIEVAMRFRGLSNPKKRDLLFSLIRLDPAPAAIQTAIDKKNPNFFEKLKAGLAARKSVEEAGLTSDQFKKMIDILEVGGSERGPGPADQLAMLKVATDPTDDGLLVSDLIQKYNFISTFVYAHPGPPTAVERQLQRADPFFFDKESLMLYTPQRLIFGEQDSNEFFELYETEFNGFVLDISRSEVAGQVNTTTVSGVGVLGLFQATRRIFSTTVFQGSIFDAAETETVGSTISVFENIFQDVPKDLGPTGILEILLEAIYKIHLREHPTDIEDEPDSSKRRGAFFKGEKFTDGLVNTSLFNIAEMIRLNQFGEKDGNEIKGTRNLFSIPMFLYANVMRMRRFNVRVPTSSAYASSQVPSEAFKKVNTADAATPKETEGSGGSVLEINPDFADTAKYQPYFLFLSSSLGDYTPPLKTPLEIMNDVKGVSYLEFFETTAGRIILRTPQYNNHFEIPRTATGTGSSRTFQENMFTSQHIEPIATTYGETAQDLVTKLQMGYGTDFIKQLAPFLYYHYTNGKLLAQYGLFMKTTQANPNVRMRQVPRDLIAAGRRVKSIFEYCRFFLEYSNMEKRRGSIEAKGAPFVEVGMTYFDIGNQKFGYITNVSKTMVVGGNYTMTFDMIAVRDATYSGAGFSIIDSNDVDIESFTSLPIMRRIPELEDIVSTFAGFPIPEAKNSKPRQNPAKAPSRTIPAQKFEKEKKNPIGDRSDPSTWKPPGPSRLATGIPSGFGVIGP